MSTGFLFFVFTLSNRQIELADNLVRSIQKSNKCIYVFDLISVSTTGKCLFRSGQKIVVVGTVRSSVTSMLKREFDLVDAKTTVFSKQENGLESVGLYSGILSNIRLRLANIYKHWLPKDEAGLVAGIVLGDDTDIGYEFYREMVQSGTVHIAVASGFNLMLLYGFVSGFLYWFMSRKWVFVVSFFGLMFYAGIAGFEPPVVRAWLMLMVLLLSQILGRKQDGWWVLLISGWMMLVWDFGLLWSVSFQLSMMSSFALIVCLPILKNYLVGRGLEKEYEYLERAEVVTTMLATVMTVPIIWWHFGRVSMWGMLSNIFVLPLVPPLMVLGILTLFMPAVFYIPVYVLSHFIVYVIHFFGS